MKFSWEQPEELSRRAHCDDEWKKNHGTMNSPSPSKGNLDNQHLEDKDAGDECQGLQESMDITTVNQQGVQWDFTNVEMRNQAFRKIVAKKTILAHGSASVCQFEVEIEREPESHDTERDKDNELHRARRTRAVCLSHVQVAAR